MEAPASGYPSNKVFTIKKKVGNFCFALKCPDGSQKGSLDESHPPKQMDSASGSRDPSPFQATYFEGSHENQLGVKEVQFGTL